MLHRSRRRVSEFLPLRSIFFTWLGIAVLCAVVHAADAEYRTWSDATGAFKVEAKLLKVEGNDVYLENKSGKPLVIPKDKLSAADQKLLAAPAAPPAKTTKGPTIDVKGLIEPNWDDVKPLFPRDIPANEWKLTLPEIKPVIMTGAKPFAFPPQENGEGFESYAISKSSKRLMACYTKSSGSTRLVLIDMNSGRLLGTVTNAESYDLVAVNDTGDEVIVCADDVGEKRGMLEIWKLGKKGIERVRWWKMQQPKGDFNTKAVWGMYLDDQRAIIKGNNGRLVVWDLSSGQPLAATDINSKVDSFAVNPDRSLLAMSAYNGGLRILDLKTLDLLTSKVHKHPFYSLAFSPDGKRLALGSSVRMDILDLVTGETLLQQEIRDYNNASEVVWADNNYLLLSRKVVFDLAEKRPIWEYNGIYNAESFGGFVWCFVNVSGFRGMVPVKLPHDAAKKAVKNFAPPPEELLLKPGDSLAIDVSALGDPEKMKTAEEGLLKQVQTLGYKHDPQANTKIIALAEIGKTEKLAYRPFGNLPGQRPVGRGEQFDFTLTTYIVKIVRDDKVLWETRSYYNPEGNIQLLANQTIEEYINKMVQSNFKTLMNSRLPKQIEKPGRKLTAGSSEITPAGIK